MVSSSSVTGSDSYETAPTAGLDTGRTKEVKQQHGAAPSSLQQPRFSEACEAVSLSSIQHDAAPDPSATAMIFAATMNGHAIDTEPNAATITRMASSGRNQRAIWYPKWIML